MSSITWFLTLFFFFPNSFPLRSFAACVVFQIGRTTSIVVFCRSTVRKRCSAGSQVVFWLKEICEAMLGEPRWALLRCLASQCAGKLLCQLRSNDLKCEIKLRVNGPMPSCGDWPWLGGDTVAARMEEGPLEMPLTSVAGITHHPARSSSTIVTSGRVRTTLSNVT